MSKLEDETKEAIKESLTINSRDIPQEYINELKALGEPKPDHISWTRWLSPQELTFRHDYLFHHIALGKTQREAAKIAGFEEQYVSAIMSSPEARQAVKTKQEELYGKDARKKLSALTKQALAVVEDVLSDDTGNVKESTKADMAKYVLDQAVGKAKQEVSVQGNLLHDLLTRLDSRDVVDLKKSIEKPPDEIDNLVSEIVPNSFKVGEREK